MKRIFSGIQPSGGVTLGNYLGAIRNWAKLQEEDYHCLYCMVDLHAITVFQDPQALPQQTREVTAALLAAGIDPKTSIVFNQSAVAEHAQLAWIFNCVARVGWMNRMTQFKEKAGKHRENASLGLYAYPALMAADILIYKATHEPVGDDQKLHLELTRDVAQKFNSDYGVDYFPLTEPLIYGAATRVMSLRDGSKKMSKSDPSDMSRINLIDDADTIAGKIRKAKTDPEPVPVAPPASDEERAARPEAYNLMGIYAALTDKSLAEVADEFGGAPFSAFKGALTD
ncbi:MAG: tryptophan--tRNA ligase, partial [Bauldia litoralis]